MYIPNHYELTDFVEIRDFIEKHSFGTLVTTDEGKPLATHLPLELDKRGDDYYLTGHLAYRNPQWQTLGDNPVLVMFQGPHAYISSSWYQTEDVPTWNYQAVHVYGRALIMDEQELQDDLSRLLQKYENHRKDPVLWEELSLQAKKQIKGIVGFKVKVEDVQAAYKLSQNRPVEDYENIMEQLSQADDFNSQQLAKAMKANREKDV
ncbi:protease synthase and sporulation protein PAI 2 [Thalassobacillus devorans]|uniref:Protease synthase and sporulation protein PAI 2 n=1 Tax=Thalassobacillus devorans TaxID=279813 RepID=A0ABQ1NHU7_9BACI|nr:FMN-binding negative transcriptional regulator [Thalassobacillus devorans]NIK27430.1 transcriptional regulator [Thalassobacillus devorans]GGC77641.1 protease synthase and sporulation protein PAI 2 [Thalassobacillus devorans]